MADSNKVYHIIRFRYNSRRHLEEKLKSLFGQNSYEMEVRNTLERPLAPEC
jgi:hypothetical protein